MKSFETIDSYIASFPSDIQQILLKLRNTIKKAAPKATEGMYYGIPTFTENKHLVHFGAYPKHIGFYPTPSAVTAFKKEISKYKFTKGTIQFEIDKPLPLMLITKITKFRVKEDSLRFRKAKQKSLK